MCAYIYESASVPATLKNQISRVFFIVISFIECRVGRISYHYEVATLWLYDSDRTSETVFDFYQILRLFLIADRVDKRGLGLPSVVQPDLSRSFRNSNNDTRASL